MNAAAIAKGLKAQKISGGWLARCPAHDDRSPSLSISESRDGKVLVHCHAGCDQRQVIAALAAAGLWFRASDVAHATAAPRDIKKNSKTDGSSVASATISNSDFALKMWNTSAPLPNTLGAKYFVEHRGLDLEPLGDLSHAVRWHARTKAVVALMTDPRANEPTGIHRTFLSPTGSKLERKMLGRQGVVRLSPDDEVELGLGICEGLEDGLAIMLSGWRPLWVATSAGAIARFPVLSGIESLTIFADADEAGTAAAHACAVRWREAGREVVVEDPRG